jgi:hypothetical protein
MTLTRKMLETLKEIKQRGSMRAVEMNPQTLSALLRRRCLREVQRLYFGPGELQYRLSERGTALAELGVTGARRSVPTSLLK